MKKWLKGLISIYLVAALMVSALPYIKTAYADEEKNSNLVLTSYETSRSGSIRKGQHTDITLYFKDTGLKSSDISTSESIDVTRLVDSFNGDAHRVLITSSGEEVLEFTVTLNGISYSGSGKSLRLLVGYKGLPAAYTTIETSISEAVEYEEPARQAPEERGTDTIPMPLVLVSRNEIPAPLEAGQEMPVTLYFKNVGTTTIKSPVVALTPSDSLMLMGTSSSYPLPDIGRGKTQSITVMVRTTDTITTASQSLAIEMKFNYDGGQSIIQGSAADKVIIPAKEKSREVIAQPAVIVTRSALNPMTANQEQTITLTFKNAGATPVVSPVALVSVSDALLLLNETSTFVLEELAPGQEKAIEVRVKAASEILSPTQNINVELKYSYNSGEAMTQASSTERINLSANTTSVKPKMDRPQPNIIINKFEYGGISVAAGTKFPLNFQFTNTSGQISVENIVATVETGENFAIDGSTNTFYYKRLSPEEELSQEIPMRVLPAAKTGAQTVEVNFKYEYVDNEKRSNATASVKLSVPVYQPDRFEISAPALPAEAIAGEEVSLSLAYVNKGKSVVSNVEAAVEGDVEALVKVQNLGNFDPGKSGNIGFVFTPLNPGELEVILRIHYEDANQELKTKEFPVKLKVSEPQPLPEEDEYFPVKKEHTFPVWAALAGGGTILLIGGAVIIKLRRKKTKISSEAVSWDSLEPEELPVNESHTGIEDKEEQP